MPGRGRGGGLNRQYVCLSPLDPAGWQIMALSLSQSSERGSKDAAIGALMMFKSLQGEEVQVGTSTRAAKADAEAALGANGAPDKVFTYTTADGNRPGHHLGLDRQEDGPELFRRRGPGGLCPLV